jgi:hypothetical protein
MKAPDTLKILQEFLQMAVPLWIMRFKGLPWEDLKQVMKESETVLEESGELATFAQFKQGQSAKAFNAIAKAIAALSFMPNGIEIFGRHFETKYEGPEMGSSVKGDNRMQDALVGYIMGTMTTGLMTEPLKEWILSTFETKTRWHDGRKIFSFTDVWNKMVFERPEFRDELKAIQRSYPDIMDIVI